MDQPKSKLRIPTVLAIVVLASGASACGNTVTPPNDAATDTMVADAGAFDAGCIPPEIYIPDDGGRCVPIV